MRRLIVPILSAVALVAALLVGFQFADRVDQGVRDFIDRVGAGWGLAIVGAATLILLLVWLRFGGSHALRRWGVVLKPLPPKPRTDDDAAASGGMTPRKRPSGDPRSPTPR